MKTKHFGNLLLFACLVTGCTFKSPAQLEFERNQWEMQQCANMGFRDGTEAFANCRLQIRAMETQRQIAESQAEAAQAASQQTIVVVHEHEHDHAHDRHDSPTPKKEVHKKEEKPADPAPAPASSPAPTAAPANTPSAKVIGTMVISQASR